MTMTGVTAQTRVMSTAARRRLMRDVKRMRSEPPEGTMLDDGPINNNIMRWNAVLYGPEGMLWDGLVARVDFEFTEEYPNKAPTVKFLTKSAAPTHPSHGFQPLLCVLTCLLYTSPSPRDKRQSRMPSSA